MSQYGESHIAYGNMGVDTFRFKMKNGPHGQGMFVQSEAFAYSDEVDHTFRRKWITDSDASGSLIPNDVDQSEQSDAYFNFTTKFPFCMIS